MDISRGQLEDDVMEVLRLEDAGLRLEDAGLRLEDAGLRLEDAVLRFGR